MVAFASLQALGYAVAVAYLVALAPLVVVALAHVMALAHLALQSQGDGTPTPRLLGMCLN